MNTKEKDSAYVAHTYARFPVEIAIGKGSEVLGKDGKRYIDMGSGIGVTAFGIADNEWIAAVTAQLSKVQHMSNLYYTSPCADLAELLCTKTGLRKVFFANSGAEANECAIKVMRKYSADKKGSDCFEIITLENSFHGRTLTTLAATGQEHYHELFQPLTPGFSHVKAGDADALRHAMETRKIAGVLLECVQGEGGVIALENDYLRAVRALCDEFDIPMAIDEVQTGNGRTGMLYAYMHAGITPDIVTTAKGLGGGLPIGAAILGEKVESVLGFGDHGSTYGGNPIAAAGGVNVLSRIDDALLANVRRKSDYIFKALGSAPGVKSVSGKGLMVGIETEKPAKEVVAECMKNGVLCLTAKTKVRLLPALNIPDEILKEAIEIICAACK